ncbi:MAG TPA: vitamin K epoxide reductase family protein [Ktedonobacterales bacterium]|nr:vitamin K epoxide reductase family protein [Ktedonobacterales bacterium]
MGSIAPQGDEQTETPMSRLLAFVREQPGLSALLVMAVVGLGVSIYLTIVHYDSAVPLVCNTGGLVSCQSVTTSAYSVVPGTTIPITIPGMLWFIALGGLAGLGLRWAARDEAEDPRLRVTTLLLTLVGLAFVMYLVYCEIVLVQRICEWCTVVHLLTLASFIIALTRWQRRNEPVMAPKSRQASSQHATRTHRATTTASTTSVITSGAHGRAASPALSRRTRRSLDRRPPSSR